MPFLFKWLTIVFAGVLLSSMFSMIGAFFGWLGSDLRDLLLLQLFMIPVAIAASIAGFAVLARRYGARNTLGVFWARLPGWLVFIVTLALSLVLIAELSFILVQRHTGDIRPWAEHLPAAAAFFSSIALAACYVVLRPGDRAAKRPDSD
jgi:hypothetical protein